MSPIFAGHNIGLPDGTQTAPGLPLIAESGICQAAIRMLRLCLPVYLGAPGRPAVADLGCLEGGYSVAFARAGYEVLGVEGRARNLERCHHVAGQLEAEQLPLRFLHLDVRDIGRWGPFDAVFCAGLLYHLDEPDAFLQLLGQLTRKLLILQTHISVSPDTVHEGRRGHWYGDHPDPGNPFGSVRNPRSFWMAEPDLLQAVRDAGFDLVLNQYDYLPDIAAGPQGSAGPVNPDGGTDRRMIIGIKSPGSVDAS